MIRVMAAPRSPVVAELLDQLRRDPALRREVATRADIARVLERLAEHGRLEQHGRAIEALIEAVRVLLIEVKSHVSRGDLATFRRKADLYERQTGALTQRLFVSPSVEPRALEMARDLGIEVSTSLEE